MRPVSHQLLAVLPAVFAALLTLLFAAPMDGGTLTYTPNIAWLITLVMVVHYSPAWPRVVAFGLGLLQDFLFHTPPGSQALLTLLLVQFVYAQGQRQQTQLFRIRWMEAAGVLVVWHVLLWALLVLVVGKQGASLQHLVGAGVVNALWYPLFYWLMTRLFAALPDAR